MDDNNLIGDVPKDIVLDDQPTSVPNATPDSPMPIFKAIQSSEMQDVRVTDGAEPELTINNPEVNYDKKKMILKKIAKIMLLVIFILSLVGDGVLGYFLYKKNIAYKSLEAIASNRNEEIKKQQETIDSKSNCLACPVTAPDAATVETPAAAAPASTSTSKKTTSTSNSQTKEAVIVPPPPPSD